MPNVSARHQEMINKVAQVPLAEMKVWDPFDLGESNSRMLTVRISPTMMTSLQADARELGVSKECLVRERLRRASPPRLASDEKEVDRDSNNADNNDDSGAS